MRTCHSFSALPHRHTPVPPSPPWRGGFSPLPVDRWPSRHPGIHSSLRTFVGHSTRWAKIVVRMVAFFPKSRVTVPYAIYPSRSYGLPNPRLSGGVIISANLPKAPRRLLSEGVPIRSIGTWEHIPIYCTRSWIVTQAVLCPMWGFAG